MLTSLLDLCRKTGKEKTHKELMQDEIMESMEMTKNYILSNAVKTLSLSQVNQIRCNDTDVYFSSNTGNICTYSISMEKVIDNAFFSFAVTNFYISNDIIGISSPTDFMIFSLPDFNLIVSEPMEIMSMCEGIITGGKDGMIRIWNKSESEILFQAENPINFLSYSDNRIAILAHDLFLFDIISKKVLHTFQDKSMICIDLSGKYIIIGHINGINLYDCTTFNLAISFLSKYPASALNISKNSDFLVVGFEDKTLKVYDLVKNRNEIIMRGHSESINICLFTPNTEKIISCGKDLLLKI